MGFQFINLFPGQSASVRDLAVPFYVSHRSHSWNDGRYGRMAQDKAQRRFGHLLKRDIEIGSNVLHVFIDLPPPVASEKSVAEIAFRKCGVGRDFPSQPPFVQRHPYNNPNLVTFTCGKQQVFRTLFENIIDDLNSIHKPGLNQFNGVGRLMVVYRNAKRMHFPLFF